MREKVDYKNVVDPVHIFFFHLTSSRNTFACNYISLSSSDYISYSQSNGNIKKQDFIQMSLLFYFPCVCARISLSVRRR